MGMGALEPTEVTSSPDGPRGSRLPAGSYLKDTFRPLVDTEARGQGQVFAEKCAGWPGWERTEEGHILLSWRLFPSRNLPNMQVLEGLK